MNRPELYKKTVDILYEAYFNDTLEHRNNRGCAVGNLVAAGLGIKVLKDQYSSYTNLKVGWQPGKSARWDFLFMTIDGVQHIEKEGFEYKETMEQIAATGYPWQELAKIEYAFESADKGNNAEDYMFNGLVAVLEVLKTIHEVDDNAEDLTRFKDHYQTRTCPA